MDIIHATSRKRETYTVQLTTSLLWETALGIAAITNTPLLHTLDKSTADLKALKNSFSYELSQELHFVEKNNTWKALLNLLHQKDFKSINCFTEFIEQLSPVELCFHCLPYIGLEHEALRKQTANGIDSARQQMKQLTTENPFLPSYIDFISQVDTAVLKKHLVSVMTGWYEAVIQQSKESIEAILQQDYNTKQKMLHSMTPEQFVHWATGGVNYQPEPSVQHVLLIPQYMYRPWTIEADIEATKVFYYPVANESITPNDRFTPSNTLLLKQRALGDETRLRIVKHLYEGEATLQEISTKMEVGKTTVHHHLKILRAAKLVQVTKSTYKLNQKALETLSNELTFYLDQ
ncbi:ArsR/SmtB family transcription factor [Virgibacillus sp. MG-45]|uniref:ArsR/SmtB family transcription factor n=1 Tax=Virgibacillus sp. MG-45 TaxID=3102791 RepID=UPI002EDAD8DC